MIDYLVFWYRMVTFALRGSRTFHAIIGTLFLIAAFGFTHHFSGELIDTNMSDSVSWGLGIANFVFFVGVAAAAAVLVAPSYVFGRKDIKDVVMLGEILAFVSITMCLLFILTDMGRPERLWHLTPPIGKLNIPSSLLAWDVMVINGYIALNLHIPGYLMWKRYKGEEPWAPAYLPLALISILWAVSIHVVTAFLLSGLGSRHFWNTPILAPRFLISAGASGPALLTLVFLVIRSQTALKIKDSVFVYLRQVMMVTMPINLFLLGCEIFHEFYTGFVHTESARYLYFGHNGSNTLAYFIWTAIFMNIVATALLLTKKIPTDSRVHVFACTLAVFGIWLEKGMGLVFPGFIPDPLGQMVEYFPNMSEIVVSGGILAFGALLFTLMAKVIIGIETGELRINTPTPQDPALTKELERAKQEMEEMQGRLDELEAQGGA